jgi:hypothetical protein
MNGIQNRLQLLKGGLKYLSLYKEYISLKNTLLILEFSFTIPGTSAAIERVFTVTNALWTDGKSRFLVGIIKVVIVTKTHFEELLCDDFYTLVETVPNYFKKFVHL